MSIKEKILTSLKENNVNPNIIKKVPTVKLTVGVETTSAKFKKLYDQLTRARYKPELKEDGKSMWIGNVCIAENIAGKAWIYPANFLKFTEESLEEGKTSDGKPFVPPEKPSREEAIKRTLERLANELKAKQGKNSHNPTQNVKMNKK